MTKVQNSNQTVDVVIIGAGPYGMAVAAYLKARGVNFRIYGNPMSLWLKHMPKGMHLKSEGFASFIYDPNLSFTLADYCKEQGLPYADRGLPVPLETFTAYGLEFQKRILPELEEKLVVSLRQSNVGFQATLDNGEVIHTAKVVMAVGINLFGYVPPMLASLPEKVVSHSADYSDLDQFKGQEVLVVGAGASALDTAALLHQAGAKVQVVARRSVIRFHDPPSKKAPSLFARLCKPVTGIGSGWKIFFCARFPQLFHLLPERTRLEAVRKVLGPAPGWFIKEQVVGKMPLHVGVNIAQAQSRDGRVQLEISDAKGERKTLTADHVIAATGYKVDLRRLTFLGPDLLAQIQSVENTPVLSSKFESSLPGLYFVGPAAANAFGPLMRFAFGAEFVAKRLAPHLAKSSAKKFSREPAAMEMQATG
jgi:thioredoxin reductase